MSKNPVTDNLLEFIRTAPTPFHAVDQTVRILEQSSSSTSLKAGGKWALADLGNYHHIRNGSSIAAFKVPENADEDALSFKIICAHTDSPALKLKPIGKPTVENYRQWDVEVYGGALYNSWLDRDLSVAGRVSYRLDGSVVSHNLNLESWYCRIPQLAIHLDREVNNSLVLNPQKHLSPIMGLLPGNRDLLSCIREAANLPSQVENQSLSFDLFLYDTTPPAYGGMDSEFIFAPRLDNLAMCHGAVEAINQSTANQSILVAALFDNEEVGSQSAQGAGSDFLSSTLERIFLALGKSREDYFAALSRSFLISADMAHALHPNYPEKHDGVHKPLIGQGPVIKSNASQRYATCSESAAYFKELCRRVKVPFQEFVNRSDLACGTTIGPITSSLTGISVVDVGNPMLSMHSAREMAGSADHPMMVEVFKAFYGET